MIWKDGLKGNVKDKKDYCRCVNENEPYTLLISLPFWQKIKTEENFICNEQSWLQRTRTPG